MNLTKNLVFLHYFSKFKGILLFVLEYMYISLLLKIINGVSWPGKIMASPFNLSKSEAIHIGGLKGVGFCPFEEAGLRWRTNTLKILGINFSLNELNFIPKFHQIEQTLNCSWRHRNLSLLGKVTVIKSCFFPASLLFFLCFVLIFLKPF